MLGSDARRDAEEASIEARRINPAERREHLAQLEGEEAVAMAGYRGIGVEDAVLVEAGEPERREDDGRPAEGLNHVDPIEIRVAIEPIAGPVGDEGAGDEGPAGKDGASLGQEAVSGVGIDQIDVAGVHVHGGDEARFGRPGDVIAKSNPVDSAVGLEGEQNGRRSPRSDDRGGSRRSDRSAARS